LLQVDTVVPADEMFTDDYAYFSSTSSGWVAHAAAYVTAMIARFGLGPGHQVIEVASNDGYLLRHVLAAGIPCLGIEPTAATAAAAEALGIPVLREFFTESLAAALQHEGRGADLLIGNNVYAHVPDPRAFTRALATALTPEGVLTLEFPHVVALVDAGQFDTVYHEHYSYFSLTALLPLFDAAGLRVFDVQQLSTHGGSLRVYGCRVAASHVETERPAALLADELRRGVRTLTYYEHLQSSADTARHALLRFLLDARRDGHRVIGYGAAAKGNTLLNYAGVRPDLLPLVCDAAPAKQGRYLPGSHVPIAAPSVLDAAPPDVVLILPWNIAAEVRTQLASLAARGTRFVVALPEVREL
jgi:SAM-dependent methyltransferase